MTEHTHGDTKRSYGSLFPPQSSFLKGRNNKKMTYKTKEQEKKRKPVHAKIAMFSTQTAYLVSLYSFLSHNQSKSVVVLLRFAFHGNTYIIATCIMSKGNTYRFFYSPSTQSMAVYITMPQIKIVFLLKNSRLYALGTDKKFFSASWGLHHHRHNV